MKLTLPRKDLLTALNAVKPVAGGALPILNQLLIVAHEKSVTCTATNLDLHIRIKTDADVAEEGKATCRAALLTDIVKMADAPDVTITLKGRNLKIECGAAIHEVTTLDPEEFPPFPRVSAPKPKTQDPKPKTPDQTPIEFAIEDATFRTMLAETVFACSTDESRHVLNGCFVELGEGKLTVAGCNGFQLALSTCEIPQPQTPDAKPQTLIIPAATVRELLRLLSGDPEKPHRLNVTTGANLAQFQFGELTIVSKLIEGNYPNFRAIMPADHATANLPRAELLRSIGRIALVADQVRLTFTTNTLAITSEGKRGTEFIGEASDNLLLPANHAAEALFSTRYLLDLLTAVPDQDLEVHINPKGASLFKTTGRNWRAVLSPVPKAKTVAKTEPKAKSTAPDSANESLASAKTGNTKPIPTPANEPAPQPKMKPKRMRQS